MQHWRSAEWNEVPAELSAHKKKTQNALYHQISFQAELDLLDVHETNPQRYPFLLQSVAGNEHHTTDILFAYPSQWLTEQEGVTRLDNKTVDGDFLSNLQAHWQAQRCDSDDLPDQAFSGGWFFFLGYELAQTIEPKLNLTPDSILPAAVAVRIPAAIVYERRKKMVHLIAEKDYAHYLDAMDADVAKPGTRGADLPGLVVSAMDEDPPEAYINGVDRIKHYIRAGDVFQVNLSRQWSATLASPTEPALVYRRLRRTNPAPFAGLARLPGGSVISSSPERLVRVREGVVESRPIAGTRPRSGDIERDRALAAELMLHPKEIAEHVMLIDLERNDLGRLCRYGSVAVDENMVLETYAHVHHIVSNIKGLLKNGTGPGDILRAVFPGGTITGCPKVRCMEIIAELEACSRGAYTGTMGYLNRDGSMDCNILIRSFVLSRNRLYFRTGAGIVYDSVPESELAETRAKAKGLHLAL